MSRMRLGHWRRWQGLVSARQRYKDLGEGKGTDSLFFDTSADYLHRFGVKGDSSRSVDSLPSAYIPVAYPEAYTVVLDSLEISSACMR
jgi:hypothetical protein